MGVALYRKTGQQQHGVTYDRVEPAFAAPDFRPVRRVKVQRVCDLPLKDRAVYGLHQIVKGLFLELEFVRIILCEHAKETSGPCRARTTRRASYVRMILCSCANVAASCVRAWRHVNFAFMGTAQAFASRAALHRSAGQRRHAPRIVQARTTRYSLRVREDRPTFAQVLIDVIGRWYESDSDFARKAGVSPSAVSRWVAGMQVPRPETIRKMAPWMRDANGRAHGAGWLLAVAYPDVAETREGRAEAAPNMHPLAREVMRLLADDSPMPEGMREIFANLLDHLIAPYRRYLRKRTAG